MLNKKFGLSLILSVVLMSTSLTAFASDKQDIKEEKAAIIQELQQDNNINVEEIDENNIIITSPKKTDGNYDKKEYIKKLEQSMSDIQYLDEELEDLNENSSSRRKRSIQEIHHYLDSHNSQSHNDGDCRVKLKSDIKSNTRLQTSISGHAYGIWDGNEPAEADNMHFENTFKCKGVSIEFTKGTSGWTLKPGTTSASIKKELDKKDRHLAMHKYSGITIDAESLYVQQIVSCDFEFGDITYEVETSDGDWT